MNKPVLWNYSFLLEISIHFRFDYATSYNDLVPWHCVLNECHTESFVLFEVFSPLFSRPTAPKLYCCNLSAWQAYCEDSIVIRLPKKNRFTSVEPIIILSSNRLTNKTTRIPGWKFVDHDIFFLTKFSNFEISPAQSDDVMALWTKKLICFGETRSFRTLSHSFPPHERKRYLLRTVPS